VNELHTVSSAARALGVSEDTVRLGEKQGRLVATRTESGLRVFTRAALDAYRAIRERRASESEKRQ
jgi:DNA-binding transcriptional MerR regulator